MISKIKFDEMIGQLEYIRNQILRSDEETQKKLHYQAEVCYQLHSLLLGLEPFLNNVEYSYDYITEKCRTIENLVVAHDHDVKVGATQLNNVLREVQ